MYSLLSGAVSVISIIAVAVILAAIATYLVLVGIDKGRQNLHKYRATAILIEKGKYSDADLQKKGARFVLIFELKGIKKPKKFKVSREDFEKYQPLQEGQLIFRGRKFFSFMVSKEQ